MSISLLHELLDAAAERSPDNAAITAAGVSTSYGELAAASRRAAGWLASMGVGRRDRVVIAIPTHPIHPALIYGVSRIGAVFVILHDQVVGHGLVHVIDDTEPALLICDDPAAHRLATARGIPVRTAETVERELDAAAAVDPPAPLSVDPVCLIYTSGSTGQPNAVVSTHAQVVFAAQAIQSQLRYRADDVVFSPLPLSFDYGLYQLFIAALGSSHVHLGCSADAGLILLRRLRQSGATILPALPSLAAILARLLERYGGSVPLRLITNTGADMPTGTIDRLRSRLPDLQVQLMFGLTECKRVAIMPPDHDLDRPGSCGRPLPGTEVVVVDDDGAPLPSGAIGEMVVRGPHVMAGYWRRPNLTASRFRRVDGLFTELRTGDYGFLDDDGYLYFCGRRDDIYKSRGFRVSAIEVEAAALRVAGVSSAAVLPPTGQHPDPVLFAVSDLPAGTLLERIREQIEHYKVPKICLLMEALPLNRNGKIDKAALARYRLQCA